MANPIETNFAYIPPPNTKRIYAEIVMNNTLNVLKKCSGRSKYFPRLKHYGLIKKLVFGVDGFNEDERDPEWINRPFIITNHEHVVLSSMLAFSENAALHMAGFIHRNVSPHSFSYPVPLTLDLLSSRMIITDLSLCPEYPYEKGSRVTVPFIENLRYSSIRTHMEREQKIRRIYRDLIKLNMSWIDPQMVVDAFNKAIERKDPNKMYELPKWLVMPSAN
uniref:Uncharacterized protein n=1 Tax=Panagrolaimus sp. PS1159 TaxID=55785 RepID=A0AC35GT02_9BILA